MNDYINTTLGYMEKYGFEIRDTFYLNYNADDFYSNGNKYDGKRLFGVDWVETDGYPQVNASKRYTINGYTSVAYDNYRIEMPMRYKTLDRDDVIIHETVHFLQKNTNEDDDNYIHYDEQNYIEYVSQRSEYEAHIVQIAHIVDHQENYFFNIVPEIDRPYFEKSLKDIETDRNSNVGVTLLVKSKFMGLT